MDKDTNYMYSMHTLCIIMFAHYILGYVIEDSNDPGPSQQTVESKSTELTPPTQEELRLKRQAFLQRLDQTARGTSDSETTDQRENQPEDKIQPQESEKSPEKKQKECEGRHKICYWVNVCEHNARV